MFIIMFFLLLWFMGVGTVVHATTIYNQDGMGYSGTITNPTLITNVGMRGYNSWPSGFTKGTLAFQGGVYDGTNVWMIPGAAELGGQCDQIQQKLALPCACADGTDGNFPTCGNPSQRSPDCDHGSWSGDFGDGLVKHL